MNLKQAAVLSIAMTASLTMPHFRNPMHAMAFTPSSQTRHTRLHYKSYDDVVDVDEAIRKAARFTKAPSSTTDQQHHDGVAAAATATTPGFTREAASGSTRATTRSSPIISLETISDYQTHILDQSSTSSSNINNKLSIVRFHAPWCKVCQTTSVSYERLAAKLKHQTSIQFASVNLSPKHPETNELKELLQIEGVPTGVIFHQGKMVGKVTLNRVNLSELKKRLGLYLEGESELDMLLDGLVREERKVKEASLVMM